MVSFIKKKIQALFFYECNSYRSCSYNQHLTQHMRSVIQHISAATCLDSEVPSSWSHYNKSTQANVPIWALSLLTGMAKILQY
jgi:hypothetical protein